MNTEKEQLHVDQKFMKMALRQAECASKRGEVPIGAVIVHDGKVIARGCNSVIGKCDPTAHAEIRAMRAAGKKLENYRLSGTTMYVTVEPCPMCAGAITHARVERLVYGTKEDKTGAVDSALRIVNHEALNHTVEVTGGILADECLQKLRDFFSRRRREKKEAKAASRNISDTERNGQEHTDKV